MPHKNLDPRAAKKLLDGGDGWVYLDVRTEQEFRAGHAAGAWNVPVMVRDPAGRMAPNPEFTAVVNKNFPLASRFVVGCASGVRSMRACEALAAAGYGDLVNLSSGFHGRFDESGSVVEPGWLDCSLPCDSAGPPERTYATLRAKK
jgi:rhodanese-related sulfurtransferase